MKMQEECNEYLHDYEDVSGNTLDIVNRLSKDLKKYAAEVKRRNDKKIHVLKSTDSEET